MRLLLVTLGVVAGCGDLLGLEAIEAPTAEPPVLIQTKGVAHGDSEGSFPNIDVTLPSATRGDLMVVAVCFVDGTITTVSDGDTPAYTGLANKGAIGVLQAQLFWAQVAATHSPFSVRVSFVPAATSPDVRIAEYRNVAFPNPVENAGVTSAANVDSVPLAVMVSQAPALVVAATCVGSQTVEVTNFTIHEITTPNGDAIADLSVARAGPVTAIATQDPVEDMILQLVAFAGGTPP